MQGLHVVNRFFLFLVFCFSPLIYAQSYFHLAPSHSLYQGAYKLDLSAHYHRPSTRLDQEGQSVPFEDQQDFLMIESSLEFSYGMTRHFDAYFGGRFRSVESVDADGEVQARSGGESLYGGLKYSLLPFWGGWRAAFDARYRHTLYSNTDFLDGSVMTDEDEIVLGDDGTSFKLGLHLSREQFFLSSEFRFFTAYHIPANDLSQEILYDLSMRWRSGDWAYGLGIEGIVSLQTDSLDSRVAQNTGQTALFNSTNRQKHAPYLLLARSFNDRTGIEFQASQVMAGESTDQAIAFRLNFSLSRSGTTDREVKRESFKRYLIESTVVEVSPRGAFVRINKGSTHDVYKGMRFDIFKTDFFGGNTLVASGIVYEVAATSAVIRLAQKYEDTEIETGFRARGH